mmetsp:Transcript_32302/g.65965  ORF Transcript_32302/g.65965 Transcript_32302/m.65965 type:complete len:93 (+) Transcript_32302:45-323(+)
MGPTHVLYFSPPAETKQPQHHNQPQRKQKVSIEGEEGSEHHGCCRCCRHSQKSCNNQQKIKMGPTMYFTLPLTRNKTAATPQSTTTEAEGEY